MTELPARTVRLLRDGAIDIPALAASIAGGIGQALREIVRRARPWPAGSRPFPGRHGHDYSGRRAPAGRGCLPSASLNRDRHVFATGPRPVSSAGGARSHPWWRSSAPNLREPA